MKRRAALSSAVSKKKSSVVRRSKKPINKKLNDNKSRPAKRNESAKNTSRQSSTAFDPSSTTKGPFQKSRVAAKRSPSPPSKLGKRLKSGQGHFEPEKKRIKKGLLLSQPSEKKSADGWNSRRSEAPVVYEPEDLKNLTLHQLKEKLPRPVLNMLDELNECKWYELKSSSEEELLQRTFPTSTETLHYLKSEAFNLLQILSSYITKLYERGNDEVWLQNLVTKGTSIDRLSALTLLIQQCPIGRIEYFKALSKLTLKNSRRDASIACEALKDLFLNDLLPHSRKLYFFCDHPKYYQMLKKANSKFFQCSFKVTDLILIWFEDFLKSQYARFVLVLSSGVKDPLKFFKINCLKYSYELLSKCPEQEKANLSIVVSKLLDPVAKDAEYASSYLKGLLTEHPDMKVIIGKQILETILLRLTSKDGLLPLLYKPILFLSELKYKRHEIEFAQYMVNGYLKIFRFLINQFSQISKPEKTKKSKRKNCRLDITTNKELINHHLSPNSRLFRTVLNGLSRVLPFSKLQDFQDVEKDWKALDQIVDRIESPAVKIEMFNVLYKLAKLTQREMDGFNTLLYNEIRHFSLLHANNSNILLNLLRQMSAEDTDLNRPLSIFRRLHQISVHSDLPIQQICFLADLISIVATHRSWGLPILTMSDHELVREIGDEVFKDVDTMSYQSSQSEEELPIHRGYNPKAGNPKYARPDLTHLWELKLQTSSIIPTISEYAYLLIKWAQTNSKNAPPVLQTVLPFESDSTPLARNPIDVLSATSILNLLSYKEVTSKQHDDDDERPTPDDEHERSNVLSDDVTAVNSIEYWQRKKKIYPHEKFLADYFNDDFVGRKMESKQQENGMEDVDDFDEEDQQVDQFLDEVLANDLDSIEETSSIEEEDGDSTKDTDHSPNNNGLEEEELDTMGDTFSIEESSDDEEVEEKVTGKTTLPNNKRRGTSFAAASDYAHYLQQP